MLWSPFGKSMKLSSVRSADGKAASDPAGIAEALRSACAPKLAKATIDEATTGAVCRDWVRPIDFSSVSTPASHDFSSALERSWNSAPGPDGLPLAAWKAAEHCGAETTAAVEAGLRAGCVPPISWSAAI